MPHLIIDGYNYLNRSRTPIGDASLEMLRRTILERLFRYKKTKGGKITVVFDAYKSYSPSRQHESYKGIEVVYSRENETADEVIIGWIRQKRAGMVVVTSDRAIIDEAKSNGVPFLTPVRLNEMMESAAGAVEKDDDEYVGQAQKRGNPRKLPKKLRKVTKSIGKL
ncbi:MAG TPA: NYN domain-containing protein [Syntrophorhabdaceae bacterium]|nr:NYN domain-containing protein [Syntrophorhabdaceae bacterium]